MEKKVIELFAGVGGFRIGLNDVKLINSKTIENKEWNFVWFNQYEPESKIQYAYECYSKRFNERPKNSNVDINLVNIDDIPNHSLLVGGFPCQDYSVAHGNKAKGIQGKKGVLWWNINAIIAKKKTPFILLENVDRLLKSPTNQRGRDFGIILKCLYDNGYDVEWMVINGAEFGFPQKRRRIFIFAYKNNTKHYSNSSKLDYETFAKTKSIFKKFPIIFNNEKIKIDITRCGSLANISDKFIFDFKNYGYMHNGKILTQSYSSVYDGKIKKLKDILIKTNASNNLFLTKEQFNRFKYLKGSKKIIRTKPNGEKYKYAEGEMPFPENLNIPGRTMLTSEGSVNRSSHVVSDFKTKKIRFLTPIECERMNEFPDNWTDTMPTKKRYFMMGNALITGLIKIIGDQLKKIIENE